MKRTDKKLFALLMTLIMVVSLLPMGAFAAGSDHNDSHDTYTVKVVQELTCEQDAFTRQDTYCNDCDYYRAGSPYSTTTATGHQWENGVCTVCNNPCSHDWTYSEIPTTGTHTKSCSICKLSSTETCNGCDVTNCNLCGSDLVGIHPMDATGHCVGCKACLDVSYTAENDETHHWYVCTCGEIYDEDNESGKSAHTPGEAVKENEVEANCVTEGSYDSVVYCTYSHCNRELSRETVKLGYGDHNLGDWTSITVEPTCEEDGYTQAVKYCENCDYVEYGIKTGTVKALGHATTTETVTVSEATCTEPAVKRQETTCSRCDYFKAGPEYTVGDALGHNTTTETVTVSEVTCTEPAVKRQETTCSRCDYFKAGPEYTVGDALGHDTYGEVIIVSEPSCTDAGVKRADTFCTRCDYYMEGLEYNYGEATGHAGKVDFSWNILTNEGTGICHCDNCGQNIELATTTTADVNDATCTEDGKTVYIATCELNGETFTSTFIKGGEAATGHAGKVDFSWNILTNEGTGICHCTDCGQNIELETVTTSETVAPTCTEAGKTVYTATCELNGESFSSTFIKGGEAATGHTEGEAVKENEKAASCTADGSYEEVVYCSACDEELSRKTITVKATGHTEKVVPAVAATCETAGKTEGKVCSVCNEVLTAQEDVAKLGHKWDAGKVTKEPTATAKGEKLYTCLNDGTHTYTTEIAATGTTSNDGLDDVPKTGDATNIFMFGGMMIVALLGAIVTFFSAKKRNNH